jgi:hypothetical protein
MTTNFTALPPRWLVMPDGHYMRDLGGVQAHVCNTPAGFVWWVTKGRKPPVMGTRMFRTVRLAALAAERRLLEFGIVTREGRRFLKATRRRNRKARRQDQQAGTE